MFHIFKKKTKETSQKGFYAFVTGTSVDITKVPDEMFADKMLGDGIAIQPDSDQFVSPCDGKISTIMDSRHAIGIETEDGIQLLLHIGLDTVKLEGKGFDIQCRVGQTVKVGDPLVTVDRAFIRSQNLNDITMMVFVEQNGHTFTKFYPDKPVTSGKDIIIEYK